MADRFATSRNFLATDRVPDSIFGIPVVSRKEDYLNSDLEFFRKRPEAGGFYSLGGESPDDGSEEGAPVQADAPVVSPQRQEEINFGKRNPSLFKHVKQYEKLRLKPYKDVGGYAIGYGAHTDLNGNPVTENTAEITEEQAIQLLERDLYARRERLSKVIPNWTSIPGNARQALLDIAMGRDDVLDKAKSPTLWADLTAAGQDKNKLLDVVKNHYYSYRKSEDTGMQDGLEARRIAGGKLFFGEDFSYDDKEWSVKDHKFVLKKKGNNGTH